MSGGNLLLSGTVWELVHCVDNIIHGKRSKLTFSKSCLLATFNGKMVAIKKNSVAKKQKNVKGRTTHDILHIATKT